MRGLHLDLCTRHIYTKEDCRPFRKPLHRINPALREVFNMNFKQFIYLTYDSKWVSPLFIVPKKNEKW